MQKVGNSDWLIQLQNNFVGYKFNVKTMKNKLSLIAIIFLSCTYGQVGINTSSPNTTLDVDAPRNIAGIITDNTQTIGLQAPRVTRLEISNNTANYNSKQTGALIYITDISAGNTNGQRINMTSKGYYYFDGSVWQKLTNISNLYTTDWTLSGNRKVSLGTNNLDFLSSATTGTSHFTVGGTTFNIDAVNNRIGLNNSVPTEVLDVNGNIRVRNLPKALNIDDYPRTVVAKSTGELAYTDVSNSAKQIYTSNTADASKTVKLGRFEFRMIDNGDGTSTAEYRLTSDPGNISVFVHLEEKWNSNNNSSNSGNGFFRFITFEKTFTSTNWSTWTPFDGNAMGIISANKMTEFSSKTISMQYGSDPNLYNVEYRIIDIPYDPENYSIIVNKY